RDGADGAAARDTLLAQPDSLGEAPDQRVGEAQPHLYGPEKVAMAVRRAESQRGLEELDRPWRVGEAEVDVGEQAAHGGLHEPIVVRLPQLERLMPLGERLAELPKALQRPREPRPCRARRAKVRPRPVRRR